MRLSLPKLVLSTVSGLALTLGLTAPANACLCWLFGWGSPGYYAPYGGGYGYGGYAAPTYAPAPSPCGPGGCGTTSAFYGSACCDPCNVCCSTCGSSDCVGGSCPGGDCGVNYNPSSTEPTPDRQSSPPVNGDDAGSSIPKTTVPPRDEFGPARRGTGSDTEGGAGSPGSSIPDGEYIPPASGGPMNDPDTSVPLDPLDRGPADINPAEPTDKPGTSPFDTESGIQLNSVPLDMGGRITWRYTPERHRVSIEARYRLPRLARMSVEPTPVMADSEHLVRR